MGFICVKPILCLGVRRPLVLTLPQCSFRSSPSHVLQRSQRRLPHLFVNVERVHGVHDDRRLLHMQDTTKPEVLCKTGQIEVTDRPGQETDNGMKLTQAVDTVKRVSTILNLSETQMSNLFELTDLLIKANREYNLTAIRTRTDILQKHIVDGLCLIPTLDAQLQATRQQNTLIDVGSGAGLPGLVIAIARPSIHVTLLEATRKKTEFHKLVIDSLQLRNVDTIWKRAEEAGRDVNHRQKYDMCVARAVARLSTLVELTTPFVRTNGLVIAQKSLDRTHSEVTQAQAALDALGASVEEVLGGWPSLFGEEEEDIDKCAGQQAKEGDDDRTKKMIVIRKHKNTTGKYPRQTGIPSKNPIS